MIKNKHTLQASFRAAWWLKNQHLQTLYPVIFPFNKKIVLKRETIILADGDFIEVDWTANKSDDKPLILLLHGLEGSSKSSYIKRTMYEVFKNGFRAVCMNFRGCSGRQNKSKRAYHAGETEDLNFYINYLLQNEKIKSPIFIVGFSLGGNVLLKWLSENSNNIFISGAIAISVPFELEILANKMNRGFSKFYQWWLLKSLKNNLLKNDRYKDFNLSKEEIILVKTFWEFDDKITARIHGFLNAIDYYKKSSSRQYLSQIAHKTLIIHSKDDPFMSELCIPQDNELSKTTQLELTEQGGHVGFISGNYPFIPMYWLEKRIINFCFNLI
ncbi:hydrolase [Fluviispira multicolorata]|uniref:hydrolase n=1 Tax=Fluviispira multicolorata TaxID=2654512 RepID=UPI001375AE13|nr:hydrolase [Fluviispira multicolorata]